MQTREGWRARHSREASSLPHDLPLSPTPNRPGVSLRVRCGMVLRVTGLRVRVREVRRAEMPSALRSSKRAGAYIYICDGGGYLYAPLSRQGTGILITVQVLYHYQRWYYLYLGKSPTSLELLLIRARAYCHIKLTGRPRRYPTCFGSLGLLWTTRLIHPNFSLNLNPLPFLAIATP